MSVHKSYLPAVLALSLVPAAAHAQKMDKDEKKWLEDVKPIMLADEEKTYKDLKDKADRAEFQKIFWARRDTDLETPANEYQSEYQSAKTAADAKYRIGGTPGSQTDCGRIALLLGEPDEVKKAQGEGPAARRTAETWTFRDRQGLKFKDGHVEIDLDENCNLPQGARMGEQLARVAEGKIAHPDLGYKKGADGKLVKLVDQLPKPTPVMALLKTPRQDFAGAAKTALFLRSPGGASYVAGLARVDANTVTVEDAGGKKTAKVVMGVQAKDEAGKSVSTSERDANAEVAADGSAVVSYGMALKPGKYTLNVAVLDPKSSKGTVISEQIEVPDFGSDELTITPLLVLRDVAEGAGTPQDAMAAFTLGNTRFIPNFGNVFRADESISVLSALYNAPPKPDTGKPSFTYSYSIAKDGKTVAETEPFTSESAQETPSVGPVPLAKYGPGKYTVKLKVKDNVANKEYTKEAPFEVK
ncbi:MAG TPA: GWxTD domain-containing protein [Vicinamibacteria bacterium]|nr:GWxTD domain-containing protein [Vicinamibacteria bacterium]